MLEKNVFIYKFNFYLKTWGNVRTSITTKKLQKINLKNKNRKINKKCDRE